MIRAAAVVVVLGRYPAKSVVHQFFPFSVSTGGLPGLLVISSTIMSSYKESTWKAGIKDSFRYPVAKAKHLTIFASFLHVSDITYANESLKSSILDIASGTLLY